MDSMLCNKSLLITSVDIQSLIGKSDHASVKLYVNLCCSLWKQEALLLQRDRATLLSVQILLTHDGGIYRT